jgi:hypothetical protein
VPDFGALIDKRISRDTRSSLARFLTHYEHLEFGRVRNLDQEEIALVLSAMDQFLLSHGLTGLGLPELEALTKRLGDCAAQQNPACDGDMVYLQNTCFDALACIKVLEARLSRASDREEIIRARPEVLPKAANDKWFSAES